MRRSLSFVRELQVRDLYCCEETPVWFPACTRAVKKLSSVPSMHSGSEESQFSSQHCTRAVKNLSSVPSMHSGSEEPQFSSQHCTLAPRSRIPTSGYVIPTSGYVIPTSGYVMPPSDLSGIYAHRHLLFLPSCLNKQINLQIWKTSLSFVKQEAIFFLKFKNEQYFL
jgi:hypothetical protein